ncbi:ArdC-like ssDNA-binding domain-containing protein [Micromonospora sp. DT81.3]|uniref:ArdC-like ssDNA-binding domain-containing protein n=1 Tax=Micromonospora sp. DT81.3 TaxID=3416523 RepID=UPI003CEFB503
MTATKTRRPVRARKTPEQRRAEAEALHETLTEQIATLVDGDNWKAWLRLAGVMRRRSFANQMLILSQGGTYCLGFRQWEALGRHVLKGSKSIKIFGFSPRRTVDVDEETGEETVHHSARYPIVSVFDITQTEGDALPEIQPERLQGEDVDAIFDRAAAFITAQGWNVALEDITQDGLNGYTRGDTRQIRVDAKMAPAMRAKTLLHEIGHALLHFGDTDTIAHRGHIETEAESVAYGAGALLGLDTSSWSIGYVAGWSAGDVEMIRSTAANVLRAVTAIADALLGEEEAAEAS